MSRLASLASTIENALHVLGKPTSRRWKVFDKVNGKLTGPDIAKVLSIHQTNVTKELTYLFNKGLLEEVRKSGKAVIYDKIPELRSTNLKKYLRIGEKRPIRNEQQSTQTEIDNRIPVVVSSRAIEKVIEIGKSFEIENIDQNWIDALVILNFIETATTKFLMDHAYTEEQTKDWKWEQKIDKLEAKLFEEARIKNVKLRTTVLTFLKNYRVLRNDVDHQAHLSSARIRKNEISRLLKDLDEFVKVVFEDHKKYCSISGPI